MAQSFCNKQQYNIRLKKNRFFYRVNKKKTFLKLNSEIMKREIVKRGDGCKKKDF